MPKMSRDIPLAEITLRKYEKPFKTTKRETIKKICLSTGLLQPGDSRDVVVDVLQTLIEANNNLTSEDVRDNVIKLRRKSKLPKKGIASSNIRRQLKRLRDMFLIEKIKNEYRINENENLSVIFETKIEKYYLQSIVERVKEYFALLK